MRSDKCWPKRCPLYPQKQPASPEWIHEVKYDGFRDGDRVRLLTRNGHDWSSRYPWIAESALKHRSRHFVIDGDCSSIGVYDEG